MRLLLLVVACGSSAQMPQPDLAQAPTADLAQPVPVYTWNSGASAFFTKYCVPCHHPGGSAQQQDFSQLAQVMANSANIRCGVATTQQSGCGAVPAPRQFPIGNGPKPTDLEREAIVAWIDAGLP
jgi:hypothetical protein